MSKIVRMPTRVTGGITADEKRALDAHAAKWIDNAMSTEPVAPHRLVPSIHALYAAAGLPAPRVVIVSSPIVMAFAGGFAAAIWWARKNGAQAAHDRLAWDTRTYSATRSAAGIATLGAMQDATLDATDDATRGATLGATDDATARATASATRGATEDATEDATERAMASATRGVTLGVMQEATLDATDDATRGATLGATEDATDYDTRGATASATARATLGATHEATLGATEEATRIATEEATLTDPGFATVRSTDDGTRSGTERATLIGTDTATDDATRRATRGATERAAASAMRGATLSATRGATHDATHDVTDLATRGATRDATDDATASATEDATEDATEEATRIATEDATLTDTGFATVRSTDDATRSGTERATLIGTDTATARATLDVTRGVTERAAEDATERAMASAMRGATLGATRGATEDATDLATRGATRGATLGATHDTTLGATEDATEEATRIATRGAFGSEVFVATAKKLSQEFGVDYKFMLQCAKSWWNMYQGGNMWSAWPCYLSAFRDVLGLRLPEHEKFAAWESCATEGGFRVVHQEFCIVSDRPEVLKVDDQNRPHCTDGPSHRWRDGWSLYHWHGMRIPEEREYIIHSPGLITVAAIEGERNSEIRRVMIDRYGPARYVMDSGAVVVHELPADHNLVGLRAAKLLRKEVPYDEPIVYVDLLNSTPEPDGTVKRYQLRVDPEAYGGEASRNCHAAVASTWRNADGSLTYADWREYAPAAES